MSRKKTAKNGQPHQRVGTTLKKMVGEVSLAEVRPFLQKQLQAMQFQLQADMRNTLRSLYVRLVTLEEIALEKFDVDKDVYVDLVADTEDKADGLEKITEGTVKSGDRARIVISTKTKDQKEFQEGTKMVLENCGVEPFSIGSELEPTVCGMAIGETRETGFGEDKNMVAKITVERVARAKKETETKDEDKDNDGE